MSEKFSPISNILSLFPLKTLFNLHLCAPCLYEQQAMEILDNFLIAHILYLLKNYILGLDQVIQIVCICRELGPLKVNKFHVAKQVFDTTFWFKMHS